MDVAALYRLHGAMVLRRATRLLADKDAAQDVVHDVFMTLHQRQHTLQDFGMVSWLYVVTTNCCLKRLRTNSAQARLLAAKASMFEGTKGEDSSLDRVEVRNVLATLPQDLAAVAIYRFVDEMTHEEIAEVMGCSRRHIGDLLERFERAMEPTRRFA